MIFNNMGYVLTASNNRKTNVRDIVLGIGYKQSRSVRWFSLLGEARNHKVSQGLEKSTITLKSKSWARVSGTFRVSTDAWRQERWQIE